MVRHPPSERLELHGADRVDDELVKERKVFRTHQTPADRRQHGARVTHPLVGRDVSFTCHDELRGPRAHNVARLAAAKSEMAEGSTEGRAALRACFRAHHVDHAHVLVGPITTKNVTDYDMFGRPNGKFLIHSYQTCSRCKAEWVLVDKKEAPPLGFGS